MVALAAAWEAVWQGEVHSRWNPRLLREGRRKAVARAVVRRVRGLVFGEP